PTSWAMRVKRNVPFWFRTSNTHMVHLSATRPMTCSTISSISGAQAGDLVAVLGIGGLGHLGVQFARKMGFKTVAIARGADKAPLARKLGAHIYLDSTQQNVAEELTKLGGAKVILATVTDAKSMSSVVP